LPRPLAGLLVFLDQRADCFVLGQVPAFFAASDIGTDVLWVAFTEHFLKPASLDPDHVLDQAAERGFRRHAPTAGFALRDAVQLADKHLAVEIKEGLKDRAFAARANGLVGSRRGGTRHGDTVIASSKHYVPGTRSPSIRT